MATKTGSLKIDIDSLLARGQGPDLFWYLEDVPLSRLAATLVAMANTVGGTLLLGISPKSGRVQGVIDPDEAVDRVFQAALLADPMLVLPIPHVCKVEGVDVVWISVPAGLPHVYSFEGRYLWREGSQNNPIPARKLRQMLLERGVIQFESRLALEATLDDLDLSQVEAYAAVVNLPGEDDPLEILLRRGCLRKEAGELRPTYSALLLFGQHPQRWLPSATILAARFSGVVGSLGGYGERFIKQDIAGSLPDQLRQAEIFARDHLRSVVRLVGLRHTETLEYPFGAVRELLVNAVAHRDYSQQGDTIHLNIFADRLEVSSPGGLPGPVTLDNLLEARFSRNAVIVQVLSDLGFVERLGYGLDRVVTLMRQSNLPAPRFEEVAGSFRVTLWGENPENASLPDISSYQALDLNPRQRSALNFLALYKRINNSDYQALCPDVHPETLRRDLADLVNRGVIMKIGDKRATYYILK